MAYSPIMEAAVEVDLLAIILIVYTLMGDRNSAGALAEPGIV